MSDAGKAIEARLGLRPYRVFLVWARWTGPERGEGSREVVAECEILPRPMVGELTGVRKTSSGVGQYGTGGVRVSQVSARYSNEQLQGHVVPERDEDQVPQPFEFFWEVVEDDRHGPAPVRRRFVLQAEPTLDPIDGWSVDLVKEHDDRDASGSMVDDPIPGPRDPSRAERVPPDDDD